MRKYFLCALLVSAFCGLATFACLRPPSAECPEVTAIATRSIAKQAVSKEVDAGRMTVLEAAAVFEWLNRLEPALPTDQTLLSPVVESAFRDFDPSEERDLCLQVLGYLNWAPARLAEAKADLRRALEAPGGLTLPPVNESDCRVLVARSGDLWERGRFGRAGSAVPVSDLKLVLS